MTTSARFGLIPLPLSLKDQAVKGEFLVDPNTGHIYLKKADGTIYSKTLELENKLNDLINTQAYYRSEISMGGEDIPKFTSSKLTVSTDNRVTSTSNTLKLDKLTLDVSPMYIYRVAIKYEFGAQNSHVKAYLTFKVNGNSYTITGRPVNHQTQYSRERELMMYEFVRDYADEQRGIGTVYFEGVASRRIEYISIQKIPFINSPRTHLLITGNETGMSYLVTECKRVNKSVTTSSQTSEGFYTINVEKTSPFTLNMRCANLIPGAYSVNITLMKPRAPLMLTITGGGSEETQTKRLPVTSMPTIGGKQGALYTATTTIYVPLAGLGDFKITCDAEEDTEIISISFQQIHTATYDHATL